VGKNNANKQLTILSGAARRKRGTKRRIAKNPEEETDYPSSSARTKRGLIQKPQVEGLISTRKRRVSLCMKAASRP